jgi:hypothetical protein
MNPASRVFNANSCCGSQPLMAMCLSHDIVTQL